MSERIEAIDGPQFTPEAIAARKKVRREEMLKARREGKPMPPRVQRTISPGIRISFPAVKPTRYELARRAKKEKDAETYAEWQALQERDAIDRSLDKLEE